MAATQTSCDVDTQLAQGEPRPVDAVRRCLFGPTDSRQTRSYLQGLRRQFDADSRRRWNFDFRSGNPLPSGGTTGGRYSWTPVDDLVMAARNSSPANTRELRRRRISLYTDNETSTKAPLASENNNWKNARQQQKKSATLSQFVASPVAGGKLVVTVREPLRPCSPVVEVASSRRHSCFVIMSPPMVPLMTPEKQPAAKSRRLSLGGNGNNRTMLSPAIERKRKTRPSSIIG